MNILNSEKFILRVVISAIALDIVLFILKINFFIGVSSLVSAIVTGIVSAVSGKRIDVRRKNIIFIAITIVMLILTINPKSY